MIVIQWLIFQLRSLLRLDRRSCIFQKHLFLPTQTAKKHLFLLVLICWMINNKKRSIKERIIVARSTGFEPAISSVTGRRDRPTSLRAHLTVVIIANIPALFKKLNLTP